MRKFLFPVFVLALMALLSFTGNSEACFGKGGGHGGHHFFHHGAQATGGCGGATATGGCATGACAPAARTVTPGTSCPGGVCPAKPLSYVPQTATIVVNLPADATLTIDGNITTSTTGQRVFESPPLPEGRDYHYTLEFKVERDGKTATAKQEVAVRAGQTTVVNLELPTAVAAR